MVPGKDKPRQTSQLRPVWNADANEEASSHEGTADSLTFGQLKKLVSQTKTKAKEPKIDYEYKEREDLCNELEDWHEYDREQELSAAYECYKKESKTSWAELDDTSRKSMIESALRSLGASDVVHQAHSAGVLVYLVNGCYGECADRNKQIQLIRTNTALLCAAKPLPSLIDRLRDSWDSLTAEYHPRDTEALKSIVRILCTVLFFLFEATCTDATTHSELAVQLRAYHTPLASILIEYLAQLCDAQDEHITCMSIRQLSILLRQCLYCSLGGRQELQECKDYRRRAAGLPVEPDKVCITTTPVDYSAFRAELIAKYPSYTPPPLLKDETVPAETEDLGNVDTPARQMQVDLPIYTDGQWSATPAPSPPPSPKGKKSTYTTDQTLPFILPLDQFAGNKVPSSIEEAAALFQSRQRTTLPLMELWQEQEHFIKSQRGWVMDDSIPESSLTSTSPDDVCAQRLQEVERIYATSLSHLQDFVTGLVSQLWSLSSHNLPSTALKTENEADLKSQETTALTKTREWLFDKDGDFNGKSNEDDAEARELEIILKGVTGSILWLLKWFRICHVLKFEYFSQLLVDADWIHTMHQVTMSLCPANNTHNSHDDPKRSYFTMCASLSTIPSSQVDSLASGDGGTVTAEQERLEQPPDGLPVKDEQKKPCNHRVMYDTINLLAITQKLVKKKTHRNSLLVQAKSWLHLRRPLRISHDLIQLYCLKLYKGQVPQCSRKWRMGNMKIITQIYLSCRPELREDWIAGTDADLDLEEAKQQENAIRALILHYNTRRYPKQMSTLGFAQDGDSDSDDDFFETEVSRMHI